MIEFLEKNKKGVCVNFTQAISSGFQNYFNFKGRASKSAFWFWMLFVVIYAGVGGFLLGMMGVNDEVIDFALLVITLPVIIPGISLTARRLHDFNQSGWMQCIFIPGFMADEFLGTGNVIYIITLVIWAIYCSQGATKGKNRFGLKPKK